MQCPGCGAWYAKTQKLCSACGLFLTEGDEQPRLGNYRLIEKIGQGGMGIVFRAVDDTLDREVAVKVLHQNLVDDPTHAERFRREARLHSQMMHGNIVTVLDVYEQDGIIALVMELVHGCSLREFLREKPMPDWGEIVFIVRGVLSGLSAAHRLGIVHRDLKLSNIFLTDDGGIKIMDFGLAKLSNADDDITSSGATVGTYYYMAPEQIVGGAIGPRTDLYALGIILYRLCTGHLPFKSTDGSEFEIMEKQIRAVPERPETLNPKIPTAMAELIMQMLEKSPDERPNDADAIQSVLRTVDTPVTPKLPDKKRKFSELHTGLTSKGAAAQGTSAKASETDTLGSVSSGTMGEPMPGTLLWVFKATIPADVDHVPLDLRSPPPIRNSTLSRLRQAIAGIPALPDTWQEVQQLLNDPMAAPSDLAAIVDRDATLASHLLQQCNSPTFALPGTKPVTQVALGITRLGMDTAHDLILRYVVPDFGTPEEQNPSRSLEVQRVWFHAMAVAHFARLLGDYGQVVDRHSASLFGMLHDIGKLVILQVEPEEKLQRLRQAIAGGLPSLQAEWETLGYTHIDAGMMLALRWKLPRSVHRFIYFHHHPCWHTPDTWPMDMQTSIMLLHMAHIALESMLDPAGDDIWSGARRTHVPGTERMLYRPLQLPGNDPEVYERLGHELDRLKALFPDLFRLSGARASQPAH
ncbi:MAG TPA: HDOD domain-containing protein [Mariprofundaceae bacterium]|nr:HDOD domain-containing protein [Mariprofundaceae bacterium]